MIDDREGDSIQDGLMIQCNKENRVIECFLYACLNLVVSMKMGCSIFPKEPHRIRFLMIRKS